VHDLAVGQFDAREREIGGNLAGFRCLSHAVSSWRSLLL
jgi:hypothetical protein